MSDVDPDVALENLHRLLKERAEVNARRGVLADEDKHGSQEEVDLLQKSDDLAQEIAEQVEALDEWLSKGGYLPKPWNPRPVTVSSPRQLGRTAVIRTCDYQTAYGLPGVEKCGEPAVGKWHEGDDEWFCAKHMQQGVEE